MDELNFDDLTPIEVPVTISGSKYVLREASGDAAVKWRNACVRAAKLRDGKVVSMDGIADTEPLLVSLCLFGQSKAGGDFNRPVNLAAIRSWPQRVQKALFAKAKDISQLDETETLETLEKRQKDTQAKLDALRKLSANGNTSETHEGNLQGAMTDGSV